MRLGSKQRPDPECGATAYRKVAGFTLLEMLVASVMFMIVVAGALSLMVWQRRLYQVQSDRAYLQANVRSAADLVASEIRTVPAGGIVAATPDSLTIHYAIRWGAVCGPADGSGNTDVEMFLQLPQLLFEDDVQSGFAVFEPDSTTWLFYPETGTLPIVALNASDTYCHTLNLKKEEKKDGGGGGSPPPVPPPDPGANPEYVRFVGISTYLGSVPPARTRFIIYSDVTYKFGPSAFQPGSRALFRVMVDAGAEQELAGLFSPAAGFEYVLDDGSVVTTVPAAQLGNIKEVRLKALGESYSKLSGTTTRTLEYNATVGVPLRNMRGGV